MWEQARFSSSGPARYKIPEPGDHEPITAIGFLALALYIDQVVDTGVGVAKHPLFFLGLGRNHQDPSDSSEAPPPPAGGGSQHGNFPAGGECQLVNLDVAAEAARVRALEGQPRVLRDAVMTKGLRKTFPGTPPKTAVRALDFGIRRGECFGMLGPNGAGKTTVINMLVGFIHPSSGDATVEGLSIRTRMDSIYALMGAREHLRFYGTLKNLKGPEVIQMGVVDMYHCGTLKNLKGPEALKSVNLLDVIDVKAGTFSGGMKRRLSVAISLIGMPLVCYLDEPSTGLDPASRRMLWACIRKAKQSRAIMLTTHSMEEAEGLCDRLAIFVGGELRCVGEPQQLTARYGGVFVITVTASPGNVQAVSSMIASFTPNFNLVYSLADTRKYEVPCGEVALSQIFSGMIRAKAEGVVETWGISSATLEDAFIKIASHHSLGTSPT
ncbi:P-loop containing nucleoside triphosphate hydrolase protein [Baffinella frigidus]|nr:P-loop containing nucleoside triphosphate hydrolase protein [Cryptophyta sp. CCMP2293]